MTVATEMPSTATYLKEKFCCLIFSKNVTKGISYSSLEIFEASTKLNGSRSFAQVYQDHLLLGDRHLRSLLKIAACAIARGPSAALFRISVRKLLMVKFPGPRAGFQGQFPPKFTLVPVGRVVGHTIDRCISTLAMIRPMEIQLKRRLSNVTKGRACKKTSWNHNSPL